MSIQLTTDQVWREIEQNLFAVLGMVTPTGEARTVGIVYVVDAHKLQHFCHKLHKFYN